VLDDYDRLFDLADARAHLAAPRRSSKTTSPGTSFPALAPPLAAQRGTVLALKQRGYDDQVCVGTRPSSGRLQGRGSGNCVPIFNKCDIPVLYNFKDEDMTWSEYRPKAKMRVLYDIYPEGILVPDFFHGKNIVHLPTIKCHIYTTTTGAMKNAFGGLLNTRRHYTHSWIHETLVDLLAIQKEIHSGLFAVMDGTTAGNGPGPRTMFPKIKNVILGSGDQVAIDAVAAKMMGFDPLTIPYIRLAHEAGLGIGDPRQIEVVGDPSLAEESWGFTVGDNGASRIGDVVWFGPLSRSEHLSCGRPGQPAILGSETCHDYYAGAGTSASST
jgi:hypothetical protein